MNRAALTGWLKAALVRVPALNVQSILVTLIGSGVLQLVLTTIARALENH